MPSCNHCYKCNVLSKCGGCRRVFYCNTDCQRSDWHNHKIQCKLWRKQQQSNSDPNHVKSTKKPQNKISGKILQNKQENKMIDNMLFDLWNYTKQIDMKSILKRGFNLYPFALLNHNNIIQTQQHVMNALCNMKNVISEEESDHKYDKNLSKLISEFVCDDNEIDYDGFEKLLCYAFDNDIEQEFIKQICIYRDKIQFFRERSEHFRHRNNQTFFEMYNEIGLPDPDNLCRLNKENFKEILVHEFETQNGPFFDYDEDEDDGEERVKCQKIYEFIDFMNTNLKGSFIVERLADVFGSCASGYFIIGKTSGGHFVGYFFFVPWR
eukprot:219930_1